MAEVTNKARVGDAFDLLATGLKPFIERNMRRTTGTSEWAREFVRTSRNPDQEYSLDDPTFLFSVIIEAWQSTFQRQLPRSTRNLVFTLRDKRNEWAHGRAIKANDAQFTLSGIVSLLEAIDASEADKVRLSLDELTRVIHDKERAKSQDETDSANVVDAPVRGLRPWREIVSPHEDVMTGSYSVAEFAADLEVVRKGGGRPEYSDPALFFERTYLTVGLRQLLDLAVQRIAGSGGQPVINCQTNFGGGKTHSLIALFHLFSGANLASLPEEIRELVASAGVEELPEVNRAVVVGNRFKAGQVDVKDDGTEVHTIWGEIAWQLGGADAYELVADSDRNGTNPGDTMRDVVELCSPCLILVDEWVAYARELYGRDDLPAGTFDSQFGFAQTLTEVVAATPGAMFVVSIPASEDAGSTSGDSTTSIEVGGAAGLETLRRLTTVVSRKAENWKPASSDESFEIVRRRLFQPVADDLVKDRDAVAEAFGEMYRSNRTDFPPSCSEMAYVDRIRQAYPIHPEVFDRLYEDWSTVERFQRTRGVLRLMAAVIASLWDSDDRSPLILPCSIPLSDNRVNGELAGKLPEHWMPVIDADIDGPNARSSQIDRQVPALGKFHATRRVARTVFIGATPNVKSANRGLEEERVRLGSLFPGDTAGSVSSALSRLSAQAPFLYVDRGRYWFDLHQNVNRTAQEDVERLLSGEKHEIRAEIVVRLRAERGDGDFKRVHVAPASSNEVVDEAVCRLVVLGPDVPHVAKSDDSPALNTARSILNDRGTSPRQFRNMLMFAAADQRSLEGLEQSVAQFLAWDSICGRVEELNLDAHQTTQAKNQREQNDRAVDLRLAEAYSHALVPVQENPTGAVTFAVSKIDSQGTVAEQVSRRAKNEGAVQSQFPAVMLRQQLNTVLARRWEDGYVSAATLWEDFAKYVYLPRLRDQDVFMAAVAAGPAGTAWEQDGFGLAVGRDDDGRLLGLVGGGLVDTASATSLLVRPDVASTQLQQERTAAAERTAEPSETVAQGGGQAPGVEPDRDVVRRFNGFKTLSEERPARDFGQILEEVVAALQRAGGTTVEINVEVTAMNPDGFDDGAIRTVTENASTLKFGAGTGFSED